MAIFSYHPRSSLHVCNDCLRCDPDRYKRLVDKEKISEEHQLIIESLAKYRILTLELLSKLLKLDTDILRSCLKNLEDYGIVIRQYYQYETEGEKRKTPVFFCLSNDLPFEVSGCPGVDWKWNPELRIEEAMQALNFNLFHLIFKLEVPHRAYQAQFQYRIKNMVIDGRYKLKSQRFCSGYSHCMVLSAVDFSESNKKTVKILNDLREYYMVYHEEKAPWYIVICENQIQAMHIKEGIAGLDESEPIYFVFAGEMEFGENPLQILQSVKKEGTAILTDNFVVSDWY